MAFRHRRSKEIEEGESYYISMTDLMVGVLFIFIIMLAYFALNFRETTTELTQAKDPQTSALLKRATDLKSLNATIDVDRENHIVCVQEADLVGPEGGKDRRCFAFSGQTAINPSSDEEKRSAASVAFFAADLKADLSPAISWAEVSLSDASTNFDADRLFRAGTSDLTPEGLSAVSNLAQSLAKRLPCLSYGVPAEGCPGQGKLEAVVIVGTADVNMYTAQGRADQALSVERSVSFHKALLNAQPALAQLRNAPEGGVPLLRVVSIGNASATAPVGGSGKAIQLQFHMKTQ
ncbi:hypothetical protein PQU94_00945 [Asticcacaulis sp. DXS10W]|uniref:OmpA-like domain-containing protein n=1 Tax=Asticcacaulis currens TaxID=2984210 RepID=A0ABT5I9I6_9CAUL|nr:hypothetical protein [Asticcacaulis currens]MDC7692839.1 hypothetical protein [Asticcacaulis currens]